MNMYDVLLAKKLSGSGGGGGGDFTTATLTVINNNENNFAADSLVTVNDEDGIVLGFSVNSGETRSVTVVLYKDFETYGSYYVDSFIGATFTCTGGVSIDDEYGDIYVTGDGTITISE